MTFTVAGVSPAQFNVKDALTTLTGSVTQTVAVGHFLFVCVGSDNAVGSSDAITADNIAGVSDSGGNVYSYITGYRNSQGANQAGASVSIWMAPITTALTGGVATLTVTTTTAYSGFARCVGAIDVSVSAGNTLELVTQTQGAADGGTDPILTVSSLVSQPYLFIAAAADENNASILSAAGTWTRRATTVTSGGSATANITVSGWFSANETVTTKSFTPAVISDSAAVMLVYKEVTLTLPTRIADLAVTETGADVAAFTGEVSPYDVEATLLFAAWATAGVPATTPDKDRAAARITALKSAGLWTGIQVLQCYDVHASAAALVNWKSPGTANASLIGTPSFTAYEGFATNGSSSAIAAFNPSGLLAQNDFHIGLWLTDTAQSSTSHFGWYDGTDGITLNCRDTSNQIIVRASVIDANTGTVTGITTAAGLTAMNRSGASAIQVYRDGVAKTVTNATAASVALNSATLNIGQPSGSFSVTHPLFIVAGVSLTSGQHATLYSTLDSFRSLPPITGTLAVTETGADIAALAGMVPVTGSLAVTETGADTAALTGLHAPIAGTLAVTEAGLDLAALGGAVATTGTLAVTEVGPDTAAFAGTVVPIGRVATLAVVETGEDIAAFTGTVTPFATRTATLAVTEVGPDTAALAGTVAAAATLAATEVGADTAALSGTVAAIGGITATLAVTEIGSDTAVFIGTLGLVGRTATLAVTETGADTAALTGATRINAALAVAEAGADTAALTGTTRISAALAAVEPGQDIASLSISSAIAASMAAVEPGFDVAEIVLRTRGVEPNIGLAGSLAPTASLRGSVNAIYLSGSQQPTASLSGSVGPPAPLQARRSGHRLRGRV